MLRIIHLLSTSNYSGAEHVAIDLIKLTQNEPSLDEIYVSMKGDIEQVLIHNKINYKLLDEVSIISVLRLVVRFNVNIIHAHDIKCSLIAACIKFFYPKLVVISHVHNNDPRMKKLTLRWVLYSSSIFLYNKIFVVSKNVKDEYKWNLLRNASVLNNIININGKYHRFEEKEIDIIMIGRLEKQKDPLRFLKIINDIRNHIPKVKVVYIGDGSLRKTFKERIVFLGLSENVHFLGFKSNPYIYLEKSRVLLLTSKYEGFGLVALEALTFGVPAVVTNVGGLSSIVDEKVGICTNDNSKLESEILKLLSNREYYTKKSLLAKERSKDMNNINKFKKENARGIYEVYKMSDTKIDILMSTFNGEEYLRAMLNSIINQTFKDWNLIIRDDGSGDSTVAILKEYSLNENRIHLVNDDLGNIGVIKSFFLLLKKSSTPFIMFADQDDVWLNSKVEDSYNKIVKQNQTKPLLLYTNYYITDRKLNITYIPNSKRKCQHQLKTLIFYNNASGCTIMINEVLKKEICKKSIVDEKILMHDYWFMLYAQVFGEIIYLDKCTMYYRQHSNNVVGGSLTSSENAKKMLIKFLKNPKDTMWSRNSKWIQQLSYFYELFKDDMTLNNSKSFELVLMGIKSNVVKKIYMFIKVKPFVNSRVRTLFCELAILFN